MNLFPEQERSLLAVDQFAVPDDRNASDEDIVHACGQSVSARIVGIVDEILTPSGLPTSFAKLVDCISQKPVVSLLGNQKPGRADECPLSTLGVLRWSLHVIIVMELVSEFQPVKRQKQVKPKPKPVQPKPAPPKQVQQKPFQQKPVQQKPVKQKPMPCPSSSSESSDSDQITWL